jgi:hypothetical protein
MGEPVAELFRAGITFPPLPDLEGEAMTSPLVPHPDGHPWRKACGECALRTSDPQGLGYNYQRWVAEGTPGRLFYCVHRDYAGFRRVCACYAALHPEQAVPTPPSPTEGKE